MQNLHGGALLLLFFELELAVVQDPADRRNGVGCDLNQVQVLRSCHLERFRGWKHTDLVSLVVDEANFGNADLSIESRASLHRRSLWNSSRTRYGSLPPDWVG